MQIGNRSKAQKRTTIPTYAMCGVVTVLAMGEIACGTSLYFVLMMVITLLSIGITYNSLNGLNSFSGIIFTGFALRTIVISQFAKVFFLESAEKHLVAPELTISLYATFYFCAMLGTLTFGRIRVALPEPLEPLASAELHVLYAVSLILGTVATAVFESYYSAYGSDNQYGSVRSISLALSPLLLFALVVAIHMKIEKSAGTRSFGILAAIPWTVLTLTGFIDTVRTAILAPSVVYLATCWVRGYKLRWKHYLVALCGMTVFFGFISPLEIYTRDFTKDMSLEERMQATVAILWALDNKMDLSAHVATNPGSEREQYFDREGTFTLSRLSEIRADSNLIETCSRGYHYGLTAVKIDVSRMMPSFFVKKKEEYGGENFLGHVVGAVQDSDDVTQIEFSAVADSFGGFGWPGVVLFSFLGVPLIFVVYESMFRRIDRPWSTIALGSCFLLFGGLNMGRLPILLFRVAPSILILSYVVGSVARVVTRKRDKELGAEYVSASRYRNNSAFRAAE